jgi:hypothetical protein
VLDPNTFTIRNTGTKVIYNSDSRVAANWVREPIKCMTKFDAHQLTSAINIKQKGEGRMVKDGLGFMHNNSNNVMQNAQFVGLYSSAFSDGHGVTIAKENLMRVVALFTARKTIKPDWINDKDEYLTPNEAKKNYKVWNNDALIYSLFHNSSNQSSLRNITYKGKKCDVLNHFFFMSREEMKDLADRSFFNEMYNDTKIHGDERYVFKILREIELSDDAALVLEKGKELVRVSMNKRKESNQLRPQYHLHSWDAGWYQIRKGILEHYEEFSSELKQFNQLFVELENRMRKGVYEFGFLKNVPEIK